MMVLSLSQVIVIALIAVVGWMAGKWLFQKDTELEERRRAAAKLAATLQGYGLTKIPDFLIDFSVGDRSGMAQKMKQLAELFRAGDQAVILEFDTVFEKVLGEKLKTEAGRALIAAKLTDASQTSDPAVVQAAPTAQVASPSK
jgi:hypothetical protein